MSRSSYVYVITEEGGKVSPFTVKHEAQDHVEALGEEAYACKIEQYRDGGNGHVKTWEPEQFLGHPPKS